MPVKIVELRTASAILRERLRQEQAAKPSNKGLVESLSLADRYINQQIALRATPGAPSAEDLIFDFLCRKYTTTSDPRQKAMGLLYMAGEVHDIARELAEFFDQLQMPIEENETDGE